MQTVLITIHLLIVIALVAVVLLQRSEGGALGVGGGSGFMTGRGQANVLTRATAILAALFFATSLGLTLLARYGHSNRLDFKTNGAAEPAPANLPPKGTGSVLDQVRQIEQQRNGAGAPPTNGAGTAAPGTPTSSSATAPASSAVTPGTKTPGSTTSAAPAATAPAEPSGMPDRKAPNAPASTTQGK